MFPDKIRLTPDYIDLIIKERKKHDLTSYQLSERLGKNKSWLPNIENKRTKNISKEDFLALFDEFAKEANMDTEMYILKNLSSDTLVLLDDGRSIPALHLKKIYRLNEPSSSDYADERRALSTDSYFRALARRISDLQDNLIDLVRCEDDPQPDELLEALEIIRSNFLADYSLALRIYHINYFAVLDVLHPNESYLSEMDHLVTETKYRFKLVNQRYGLYRYFKAPGNMADLSYQINICDPSSAKKLNKLIPDIETYISELSQYIGTFFSYPYSQITDFQKFYTVAEGFCKDFAHASKIPYSYEFKIPMDDSSEAEVKDAQLQINNIFFDVKKRFKEKYHIKNED